ncbi:glycosyltransferase [Caulobacter sp.]|uniref:glycosyltransferase n=1 Tax=Caulobacter sp. TaxID=78 RepID=UPI003BAE507D
MRSSEGRRGHLAGHSARAHGALKSKPRIGRAPGQALAHLRATGFKSPTPFEVRIAGEGAQRERLQAMIDPAGLDNVFLTGFCDTPREFLAGLHLYLQPSRREGLCIAVHEAMQAGLPTLVTAVGEMPYSVVDGLMGRVAPPCDSEELAKALKWFLRAPYKLARMGEVARSRVLDRFGQAHFAATGAEIFAQLPVRRHPMLPAIASPAA